MSDYLQPLLNLAIEWSALGNPFNNACKLAEGWLSLVVVLLEPCDLGEDVSYDVMLWGDVDAEEGTPAYFGSPTLREIDAYVRFASDDKYGLEDISVFDMNTLLSQRRQRCSGSPEEEKEKAHDVFWDMIIKKKPDVILVLQCDAGSSRNRRVRWFWSSEKAAGTMDIINLEGHETLVVRGFHPSTYLRQDYVEERQMSQREQCLRIDMLQLCFDMALNALQGLRTHDETLKTAWTEYCLAGRSEMSVVSEIHLLTQDREDS